MEHNDYINYIKNYIEGSFNCEKNNGCIDKDMTFDFFKNEYLGYDCWYEILVRSMKDDEIDFNLEMFNKAMDEIFRR